MSDWDEIVHYHNNIAHSKLPPKVFRSEQIQNCNEQIQYSLLHAPVCKLSFLMQNGVKQLIIACKVGASAFLQHNWKNLSIALFQLSWQDSAKLKLLAHNRKPIACAIRSGFLHTTKCWSHNFGKGFAHFLLQEGNICLSFSPGSSHPCCKADDTHL